MAREPHNWLSRCALFEAGSARFPEERTMQPNPLVIGIFVRNIGGYYFGGILSGIHEITRRAGVPLLVIQGGLEDLQLPPFGTDHVAGWMVIHPVDGDSANLAALVATGVPVVTVATAPEHVACSSVVVDNRGDTRALVHHLIDHGHRQIAYIDQGKDSWSQQRYQGYVEALHARGIALDPVLVLATDHIVVESEVIGDQVLEGRGAHATHALIARGMPCTALVAGTDHSAIAAMQVLQAAGYRIPDDVAVVGFDDIAEAQSLLAGCNAFVPKPIHVEQLLEALATQLGLTWRYAEGEWPDPAQPDGADTSTFAPPQAELALLFELASIGDILGVQARAVQLEQLNPQLRPFTQRLGHLADRFELEQALALIARYLQPEE
jgi:DNA-binding LacI/PurR family transcriptional regulator